jgi:hypothetical protein
VAVEAESVMWAFNVGVATAKSAAVANRACGYLTARGRPSVGTRMQNLRIGDRNRGAFHPRNPVDIGHASLGRKSASRTFVILDRHGISSA